LDADVFVYAYHKVEAHIREGLAFRVETQGCLDAWAVSFLYLADSEMMADSLFVRIVTDNCLLCLSVFLSVLGVRPKRISPQLQQT